METQDARDGHKKTSQGEAVGLLTMRVAALAMTSREIFFAPKAGGKT
jgi:hypothetical protein